MSERVQRYRESLARIDEEIAIGQYIRQQTDADRAQFREQYFQKGSGPRFTGSWENRLRVLAASRPELTALTARHPDYRQARERSAALAEERFGPTPNSKRKDG